MSLSFFRINCLPIILHKQTSPVYLIEEWLFFRQYRFHKQKLLLHRADETVCRRFSSTDFTVGYIECTNELSDVEN